MKGSDFMKIRLSAVFILLLSLVLIVSLTACKTSKNSTDEAENNIVTETSSSDNIQVSTGVNTENAESLDNSDSNFSASANLQENELEILTNPQIDNNTPVENTENSNGSAQQATTQKAVTEEPTLPFKGEIELPFIPAN